MPPPFQGSIESLGTAVFYGMLGVTFFGLFLTPVSYAVIRGILTRGSSQAANAIRLVPSEPPVPERGAN